MSKLHPKAIYLFWWQYFWIFLIAFGILGIIFSPIFLIELIAKAGLSNFVISYFIAIFLVSFILSGIWSRLFYNSYSFEVSGKSLNVKWGVIWKHSSTIPYSRIQNIDVHRGVMARILGLSVVWVQTAGSSIAFGRYGALRFAEGIIPGLGVKEAEKLRKQLLNKIKGRQGL